MTRSEHDDLASLVVANEAFYDAFERRDFGAMCRIWEQSDQVICTHPGWASLHGWPAVEASWGALLDNAENLQFIVTNVRARVGGESGWVTCDENVLNADASSTVAATNIFVRDAQSGYGWRLVAHHGSLVHASIVMD